MSGEESVHEKSKKLRSKNREIYDNIEVLLNEYRETWKKKEKYKYLTDWLIIPYNISTLVVVILLIVSLFFIEKRIIIDRIIVEIVLIILLFILNMVFHYYMRKREYFHIIRKIEHHISILKNEELSSIENISKIKNDLMKIVKLAIDKYHSKMHSYPFKRVIDPIRNRIIIFIFVTFLLSLIASIIRYVIDRNEILVHWAVLFLMKQAYVIIPLLNLSFQLIMTFIFIFHNAKIVSLYQLQQCTKQPKYLPFEEDQLNWTPGGGNRTDTLSSSSSSESRFSDSNDYSSSSSSSSTSSSSYDIDIEKGIQKGRLLIPKRKIPYPLIYGYSRAIFFDTYPFLPRNHLFDTLGTITDLCCVDQHLVREPHPFAERIFTFHNQKPVTITLKRNNQDNLEFIESKWRDYLPQLKPLGLNFMLMREYGTQEENEMFSDYDEGLLMLAKVIGFSDSIVKSFERVHEIKSIDENEKSLIESLIVKDLGSSNLQLLSRGDPIDILSKCVDYWDGKSIQPLSDEDREAAIKTYKTWQEKFNFFCIGFSYKHVPNKYSNLFKRSRSNSVSKTFEKRRTINLDDEKSSLVAKNDDEEEEEETEENLDDNNVDLEEQFRRLQKKEIFIGIVGLRHQPKLVAPLFIDQLNSSHVRFVYFTEEDEHRSKIFANKLGLETDWNCLITLKDSKKARKRNKDVINKLPVGISNIRDHILNVDNVPLLVRLFIDADSESKKEMISILEENGEVTLCIGSLSDKGNYGSFIQSNISIGLLIDQEEVIQSSLSNTIMDNQQNDDNLSNQSNQEESSGKESSHHLSYMSIEEFTSKISTTNTIYNDLMNISCEFVSRKSQLFGDILELIYNGRKGYLQTITCFIFLMSCLFGLSLFQLLSSIIILPDVLTGIHLLFLTCVIIPIITISLVFSPPQPKIMELISDKNKPYKPSRLMRYSFYFLIRTLPTVILSMILFIWVMIYVWNIPSLTEMDKFKSLIGAIKIDKGAKETSNYYDALHFSQNITAFFIVIYIVIASMSFINRVRSIFKLNPFRNRAWIGACIVSILIQIIIFLIWERDHLNLFKNTPEYMYIVGIGWVIFQFLIDEYIKSNDRSHYKSNLEILKLNYNTKLGMHSPI